VASTAPASLSPLREAPDPRARIHRGAASGGWPAENEHSCLTSSTLARPWNERFPLPSGRDRADVIDPGGADVCTGNHVGSRLTKLPVSSSNKAGSKHPARHAVVRLNGRVRPGQGSRGRGCPGLRRKKATPNAWNVGDIRISGYCNPEDSVAGSRNQKEQTCPPRWRILQPPTRRNVCFVRGEPPQTSHAGQLTFGVVALLILTRRESRSDRARPPTAAYSWR